MNRSTLKYSRGVGLIEVLVTMLLLSTALLTLASLQTRSLEYNQGAYFRSQANILAYDILDRIRVNKAAVASYNFTLAKFIASSPGSTVADIDIYQWRQNVDARLPEGKAGIECGATNNICKVSIEWAELNSSGSANDTYTKFEFASRIGNK